ncbi:hypothetical protein [Nonomuraea sp. NPDC048916]|uniref:hypothetical protein n=1 Tax=Nonomuraea sp. NPDC048916 TaxID=3154232 RepID=UPI0033CF7E54
MTTGPANTEEQLREVLDKLANSVQAAPDAYRRVQGEWRRRERRRRITLVILLALIIALADIAGLWALNQYRGQQHNVFNVPVPSQSHSPASPG